MELITATSDDGVYAAGTRAVATGGYIGIYTLKSVYLKFFMWLFCLL